MNLEEYIEQFQDKHGLKMSDLRDFVNKNPQIPGDTMVVVERVEDKYFENQGWHVYNHPGWFYNSYLSFNNSMDEENERRKRGEIPEFEAIENPLENKFTEDDLEESKEQFFRAWDISNLDNKLILIYNHY